MAIPKPKFHAEFDLTKLVEHPDNPRKLSSEGEKKLDASLAEFGMVETIVANKREDGTLVVVGGHQRLRALLKAGVTKSPVSIVTVEPIAEKRLLLMLNGHHGSWEGDKLEELVRELKDENVDLHSLGLDGMHVFEEITANLASVEEELAGAGGGTPETREVLVDDLKLKHRCPKCGFEFDKDTNAEGRRASGAGKGHTLAAGRDKAPAKKHQVVDDG